MNLTREQELYLINLGIASLLDSAMHDAPAAPVTVSSNGNGHHPTTEELTAFVQRGVAAQTAVDKATRRWTPERRAKFMATMARNKRKRRAASA